MRSGRRLVRLAIPALIAAACASEQGDPMEPHDAMHASAMRGRGTAGTVGGALTTAQAETRFMQDMIDHHQTAVEMGKLCPGRAPHPELRTPCASVEIAQMQEWLRRWYGVAKTPTFSARDAEILRALAAKMGAAFEIAWIEVMNHHHHMAIMMAQHVLPQTTRPELRALVQSIVASQSAEVTQMRGWLAAWYGRTRGGMMGGGMAGMSH